MSLENMKLKYSQPPFAVPLTLDAVNHDENNGSGDPSVGDGLTLLNLSIPANQVRLYSAIRIQLHRVIAGNSVVEIRTYVDSNLKTKLYVHNTPDSPFIDINLIEMMTPGARWYFYDKSAIISFKITAYSGNATAIIFTVSAFYLSG